MSQNATLINHSGNISTVDYAIVIISVIIPFCIAIWTAFKSKKTTQDFFTANKSVGPITVALSFLSTMMTAYMIIAYCAEIYAFGLEFSVIILGAVVGIPLFSYMNMSVFYNLRVFSIYEYLEKRFNSPALRVCIVAMDCLKMLVPMGVGLSGLCLILSSVTPIDVKTYIYILATLCAIYATVGGMRGVIWTDAFMMIIIIIGLTAIIVVGSWELSPSETWMIARQGGRTTIFNFNPSLYQRQNFYLLFIHGILMYGKSYASGQSALQRVYALSSHSDYKWVISSILFIFIGVHVLMFWAGLTAYSIYAGCDPVADKKIEKLDQIIPYLIRDKMSHITAVPGLFLAAMVSAGVSTITSYMAVFSNLVYSDLLCKIPYIKQLSERKALILCKLLTLITAVPSIGIAIIATKAGSMLTIIMLLGGLLGSPSFGVFFLGLLFPTTKLFGAIVGFFTSFGILTWIVVGRFLYSSKYEPLPFSTKFCQSNDLNASNISEHLSLFYTSNDTLSSSATNETSSVKGMYDVSYLFFSVFGPIICVAVGLCVSHLRGAAKVEDVPQEFISPIVRRLYYKKTAGQETPPKDAVKGSDHQNTHV